MYVVWWRVTPNSAKTAVFHILHIWVMYVSYVKMRIFD